MPSYVLGEMFEGDFGWLVRQPSIFMWPLKIYKPKHQDIDINISPKALNNFEQKIFSPGLKKIAKNLKHD